MIIGDYTTQYTGVGIPFHQPVGWNDESGEDADKFHELRRFPKMVGTPHSWMVYFMENPSGNDYKWMITGVPLFAETTIWLVN